MSATASPRVFTPNYNGLEFTRYERIDIRKLQIIHDNWEILKARGIWLGCFDIRKSKYVIGDAAKTIIRKYQENIETEGPHEGEHRTLYRQTVDQVGRYIPVNSNGLGCLSRRIRHTISEGMIDVDMKNAHISLMIWLARHMGIEAGLIEHYHQHRDEYLREIQSILNCDKDEAKRQIISVCYGGNISTHLWGNTRVVELAKQIVVVNESIAAAYPEYVEMAHLAVERARERGEHVYFENIQGKAASRLLQDVENEALMTMIHYLEDVHGIIVDVFIYDGFMVRVEYVEGRDINALLAELEQVVYEKMNGLELKLVIKEMDEAIDLRGLSPAIKPVPVPVVDAEECFLNGSDLDLAMLFFSLHPDDYMYENETQWWYTKNGIWGNVTKPAGPPNLLNMITETLRSKKTELCDQYKMQLAVPHISRAMSAVLNTKMDQLTRVEKRINTCSFVESIIKRLRGLYQTRTQKIIQNISAENSHVENVTGIMDQQRHLFAFSNRVYDLRTRTSRPIERTDYIKTTCGYAFPRSRPETRKQVKKFLMSIWESEEMMNYWLDITAACLCGIRRQQAFFIHTGAGGNGKSAAQSLLTATFGGYYGTMSSSILTQDLGANSHTSEIAMMVGKRFVVVNEPEADVSLNEGIIKHLTGGEQVCARLIYKEPMTFEPAFSLNLFCNSKPSMKSLTGGGIRRIRVIDYPLNFVEDPTESNHRLIDPVLSDLLKSVEWRDEFILMLIDHYPRCEGKSIDGLVTPKSVLESCQEYINDSSAIWQWWTDEYQQLEAEAVLAKDVIREYNIEHKFQHIDMKKLKTALGLKGVKVEKEQRRTENYNKRVIKGWMKKLEGTPLIEPPTEGEDVEEEIE